MGPRRRALVGLNDITVGNAPGCRAVRRGPNFKVRFPHFALIRRGVEGVDRAFRTPDFGKMERRACEFGGASELQSLFASTWLHHTTG